MSQSFPAVVAVIASLALASGLHAQDKSAFSLFNPTPRALLRPLSADRPDATESPITVDAGHVQIELSFFDYTRSDHSGDVSDAWILLDTNVKLGLLNNVDLQFVFSTYTKETDVDGFGDVQLRLKANLWGNDGGTTAFGVMPFVKFPTNTELSNGEFEGGLIVMLGWDAGATWGLGFQAEADLVYDPVEGEHDVEFSHTVVVGFDVVDPLAAYIEYLGVARAEGETDYQAILSGGLTYGLNPDMVFDAGAQIGLTDLADDLKLFAGMTLRL